MLITILIFIAVLAVLVLSHEWGHFFTARKNGIRVDEFGFGFPPRLGGVRLLRRKATADQRLPAKKWEWILGSKEITEEIRDENYDYGTLYSFNLLPLGGFVKIKGENATESGGSDSDSFATKKAWQKSLVLCAGVIMNVVVAIVLTTLVMLMGAPQDISDLKDVSAIKDRKVAVLGVVPGRPAEAAGVEAGDMIIKLDELDRPRLKELQAYVDEHRDKSISVTLERGENVITKQIQPAFNTDTGKAGFGISIAEFGVYPWYQALYEGTLTTFRRLWMIMVGFYELIRDLVLGRGVGAGVAGPVGVAKMTGQVARLGFIYLLDFTALLSLNLAVLNILPIPALDGGRLLFVVIGKIMRRPVTPKVEQIAHVIGFMLLMIVVILATGRDLHVVSFVSGLWQRVF